MNVLSSARWSVATFVLLAWALAPAEIQAQPTPAPPTVATPSPKPAKSGGSKLTPSELASLHLPKGKPINFDYPMNDGAGVSWQINSYGGVTGNGNGTAYGNAMQLTINNNNFNGNAGWANAAGDEVEIGPFVFNNVQVHRRVKVYKDAGMARWVDIIQNTSNAEIAVNYRLNTYYNWSPNRWLTNTGGAAFGDKDTMILTDINSGGQNIPSVLHFVADLKAKVRPRVQANSNQYSSEYTLNIPAGGAVLLCHFEFQAGADALAKTMTTFKAAKYVRDIPQAGRRLIANLNLPFGPQDIELERSDVSDSILLKNGDPIFGKVTNESFDVETLFAKLTVPSKKLVGMVASASGDEETVRFILSDGQVVSGKCGDAKLKLTLPTGGDLLIPLGRIKNWSYQLTAEKPEEFTNTEPLVVLRTGDQLAFDPQAAKLQFRSRNGLIDLNPADMLMVTLEDANNGVHRAHFLNGSKLAGMLEPQEISLSLSLGHKLQVQRDMVTRLRFAPEEVIDESLTLAVLSNEDQLFGAVTDGTLSLVSEFNTVPLKPATIRSFKFDNGAAAVQFWDNTVLRGHLEQEELTFQIMPGPALKIPISQIVSMQRGQALLPEEMIKKVEQLVGRLGAESYKDRQSATEELAKMGVDIAPQLQKHLDNSDPEVRQRIEDILERIGAKKTAPVAPIRGRRGMMFGAVGG